MRHDVRHDVAPGGAACSVQHRYVLHHSHNCDIFHALWTNWSCSAVADEVRGFIGVSVRLPTTEADGGDNGSAAPRGCCSPN